jgi:hypothetical protein
MKRWQPIAWLNVLGLAGGIGWTGCSPGGSSLPPTAASSDATALESTPPTPETAPDAAVETATPPDATSDTAPPDVPRRTGDTLSFVIEPFDVSSGQERQVCRTVNLPSTRSFEVVRLSSSMAGTSHHFNLYKVINDLAVEPVSNWESTVHDCEPADEQLSGDAAYIFGSSTPERTFQLPPGVAFLLAPNQRLILEQHVLNYTPETMQGGVEVTLEFADPGSVIEHHADILWFGNWGFYLPPGQETSDTLHCTVPYDVAVFGVMSHFHSLGTHFSVSQWTSTGSTLFYEDDDWAHPKYQEFPSPIALQAGEGLEWTCTWFNSTKSLVVPGKTSKDEMCITFAAYYPTSSKSGSPIQCNKF